MQKSDLAISTAILKSPDCGQSISRDLCLCSYASAISTSQTRRVARFRWTSESSPISRPQSDGMRITRAKSSSMANSPARGYRNESRKIKYGWWPTNRISVRSSGVTNSRATRPYIRSVSRA